MTTLLTDAQVASFVANGIVTVQPQLPASFHRAIYDRFDRLVPSDHVEIPGKQKLHNPGNNIVPLLPQLDELFEDPAVKGALTSLVGAGYYLEPHRALHNAMTVDGEQHLHKDSYCGFKRHVRSHRPWMVILFYYPQETPPERGPTGVVRGSQYSLQHPGAVTADAHPLGGAAGCCAIAAADIWHARMWNRTSQKRFMLKFLATRVAAPSAPSWDCADSEWRDPADAPPVALRPVWRSTWNWLAGRPTAVNGTTPDKEALYDSDESRALSTAYELAGHGAAGIAALADALTSARGDNLPDNRAITSDSGYQYQEVPAARAAAYGLGAAGPDAAPALAVVGGSDSPVVRKLAAFALGETGARGPAVVQALARAAGDSDEQVRINAQYSLGRGGNAPAGLDTVRAGLRDPDDEVRIHAAIALVRAAAAGATPVDLAAAGLKDPNRYVIGLSVEALDRIGTPEAHARLIPFLKTARWCPYTIPGESIY